MPMAPFMERFPELGPRETRTITVIDQPGLPPGTYGFFELYCDEPGCDCRRVTINVLRPETGWSKVWATISYGWESLEFYRKWGGPFNDPREMQGPVLDTLNAQSKYSSALLDLFRVVLESPGYIDRLKRHYEMFRASVDGDAGRSVPQRTHARASKRKRLRRNSG